MCQIVGNAPVRTKTKTIRGHVTIVPEIFDEIADKTFNIQPCNEGQPLNYSEFVDGFVPAVTRLFTMLYELQQILKDGSFSSGIISFDYEGKIDGVKVHGHISENKQYLISYNGECFEFEEIN